MDPNSADGLLESAIEEATDGQQAAIAHGDVRQFERYSEIVSYVMRAREKIRELSQ